MEHLGFGVYNGMGERCPSAAAKGGNRFLFSDIDSISGMNLVDVVNVLYFPYLCIFIYIIYMYMVRWLFMDHVSFWQSPGFPENRRNFQGAVVV